LARDWILSHALAGVKRALILSDLFERAARLKQARIGRGFTSARIAADYLGVPYGTYSGHENGSRGFKDAELRHYAKIFRVSPSWLAFGTRISLATLKIVGAISGSDKKIQDSKVSLSAHELSTPYLVPDGMDAYLIATPEYQPFFIRGDIILLGENLKYREAKNNRVAVCFSDTIVLGTVIAAETPQGLNFKLLNGSVLNIKQPRWVRSIEGIILNKNKK